MIIRKTLIFISLLMVISLSGCGKENITVTEDYTTATVSSVKMDLASWQLKIIASSDEDIHVSFDGSISSEQLKPTAELENGILTIRQSDAKERAKDQIALGKKGEIILYIPSECNLPIEIINSDGEIEVSSITSPRCTIVNASGYVAISNISAECFNITSSSGDIKILDSTVEQVKIATSSGYVTFKNVVSSNTDLETKSGEVNMSAIGAEADLKVETGSGDINISYKIAPKNLKFNITASSEDISTQFQNAQYTKETSAVKQGSIGTARYELSVRSDSGTVVIK